MTLPEKSVWDGGSLVPTVYVPGSSIRGALRNGAGRAIAAARAKSGCRMTPDDFLLIAKGGIKDRKESGKDERVVDYDEIAALRREQPIVSLFGAMEKKIAGRWQIGDAVPEEPLKSSNWKGRGVRSHPFQRQPELANFMGEAAYQSFLSSDAKRVEANMAEDEAESLDREIARERKRGEPDLERIQRWGGESKELKDKARALREEAGGVVNIQQLLGGWEAIPAGTRMKHRMRIRETSEKELATALFALRQLARDGRLGAHESRGEGYFSASYQLRLATDGCDFQPAGALCIADFELVLESRDPVLNRALERSATILEEVAGRPV